MSKKHFFLSLTIIISCFSYCQNLPTGFTSYQVLDGFTNATSFTFIDKDSLLLAKQSGEIYLFANEQLSEEPVIKVPTITTSVGGDQGLVAINIDPNYPLSPYVYVNYTVEAATHNVLSRFKFINSSIDLASEEILLEFSPLIGIWHTGGAIVFDDQGHLFTSTGDNSKPDFAQDMNTTHGKIIRINKDGSIPTDNPYYGSGELNELFWSIGLRNPYTMAIHKATNTIFSNQVGQKEWEEINDATIGGRNFGWPIEDGFNETGVYTYDPPTYAYAHPPEGGTHTESTGYAITGGAFYDPLVPKYPEEYVNKYFFIDYYAGWINYIDPELDNGGDGHDHIHDLRNSRKTFATDLKEALIYLTTSPDGYLYYYSRFTTKLYKIIYYEENEPIIIDNLDDITTMVGGGTVFEVVAAGAADLNYEWYKNGVIRTSAPNANIYSFSNTTEPRAGDYQVKVFNDYGEVWSAISTLTVIPYDEPPTVTIITPLEGDLYQAGQIINFSASGTDLEDGNLAPSQFEWYLNFHHDTHIHDGPAIASGVTSGSFIIPDIGETSSNVWFEIIAKVQDNLGQTVESSVGIYPITSDVTFKTIPQGLNVNIDGEILQTPSTQTYVEYLKLPINKPSFQSIDGIDAIYRFSHWSETIDGSFFTIPEENIDLIAYFEECTNPDEISTFTYEYLGNGEVQLNWSVKNTPCIQGFMITNKTMTQTYDFPADNSQENYSMIIESLPEDVEFEFEIMAYNEYGVSTTSNLLFTLGIKDILNPLDIVTIFPNPTNGMITIKGLNSFDEKYELQFYTILGKSINHLIFNNEENNINVDLSSLPIGIYILKLNLLNSQKIFKVIKN